MQAALATTSSTPIRYTALLQLLTSSLSCCSPSAKTVTPPFIPVYIQYSYLYQLISDANGILVFLKFLTDKFDRLQPHPNSSILTAQGGL